MLDKYGVGNDSYCYKDSDVLVNILGIKDGALLHKAERDISNANAAAIEFQAPPYDLEYLKTIHHQLFKDLYSWAGELRTVDISKADTRFCNVQRIEKESEKIFAALKDENFLVDLNRDELTQKAAEYYGDINMLHPFREGNGRAQRILFEHLIVNAGFDISWAGIDKEQWIEANEAAVVCDYAPLARIFEDCIGGPLPQ